MSEPIEHEPEITVILRALAVDGDSAEQLVSEFGRAGAEAGKKGLAILFSTRMPAGERSNEPLARAAEEMVSVIRAVRGRELNVAGR